MHRRLLCAILALAACTGSAPVSAPLPPATTVAPAPTMPTPPTAARHPHPLPSRHGATRDDPYYWLRDDTRKDPAVLAHLNAENAYARQVLAPSGKDADAIYSEIRGRLKEDDSSVPTFDNGYWYYTRFEAGKQHEIYARKRGTLEATEEVLLDENVLAAGHPFYKAEGLAVSHDNKLLAYAEDTVGRNQFTLRIKDLTTGALRPETVANVSPQFAWANDHKTLFYVTKDPTTLREDKLYRIALGEVTGTLVHHEQDPLFSVGVEETKSRAYVALELVSLDGTEIRLIDAGRPAAPPRVVVPRERGHIYTLDHVAGRFVIRTNHQAKNYRLVQASERDVGDRAKWRDLIPHDDKTLIEAFAPYRDFIAVRVRSDGLRKVRVLPAAGAAFTIDAPEAAYVMTVVETRDVATSRVRYTYASLVQPEATYELDVKTRERTLLKQRPVTGYDPALYATEYLHAKASDGVEVPISVVYKKTTKRDGSAPLLVTGYGSYGISSDPTFSSARVSLLDRGWVIAVAHVRGGQEMGRRWYDDGKLLNKKNTFTDFIAVTEHLVKERYGAPHHVFASGGSAGGLLMGAIANMRPDLYRGIIAQVPFVDVITTMTDVSIPLTTGEFVEWGNPIEDAGAYAYMLSYSPYDNVAARAYPAMYVKTGLWDSQVQYYEPAKWVAKLRAYTTSQNPIVLVTDMTSGHGGASGRFDAIREVAAQYAFLLQLDATPDPRQKP